MYKFLLCWRYLLSRYIALASVISVMLGVATMIVVNAVMLGFTTEMQDRIHGILSDVIFESRSIDGFPDAEWHMEKIMQVAGDKIEGLTPTVVVPAMMSFQTGLNGEVASRPIELVGIDELTQSKVSQVAAYLQHAENRRQISFDLREGGYDILSQGDPDKAILRNDLRHAGWVYRRTSVAEVEKLRRQIREEEERLREQHAALQAAPPTEAGTGDGVTDGITDGVTDAATGAADPGNSPENPSENPFAVAPSKTDAENVFDPAKEQHTGAIIGIALSQYFRGDVTDPATGESRIGDSLALIPGDDITLTIPMTEIPPKLRHDRFTVVDLYESKMMEYDSRLVFVPIQKLQDLRGMVDPRTGRRMVTQILIKAKPGVNLNELRDVLQVNFPSHTYNVKTWADVQETLLAAVFMEVSILNVLLFLIIAVAGFGILAIFFMIVVEKTKDIGILKSLGAGSGGIMQIFLYYSFALGVVGSCGGMVLGLLFVHYIKEIAGVLSKVSGHNVFDPTIYSFYEIPTIVQPFTVCCIVCGAIAIAVAAGVFPALRAARMHPVEALRN